MSDDVPSAALDEAKEMESQTDWDALEKDALEKKTDEEIREAAQSDPETHLLDEEFRECCIRQSLRGEGAHLNPPR